MQWPLERLCLTFLFLSKPFTGSLAIGGRSLDDSVMPPAVSLGSCGDICSEARSAAFWINSATSDWPSALLQSGVSSPTDHSAAEIPWVCGKWWLLRARKLVVVGAASEMWKIGPWFLFGVRKVSVASSEMAVHNTVVDEKVYLRKVGFLSFKKTNLENWC